MDKLTQNFSKKLLAWYDVHGRHTLPWKQNPSAYRVWISEIMLQQTQVATVIPYYEHFLKSFPTLKKLAEAPIDLVLKHWAGLGYYARGRNLHKAAQMLVQNFHEKFPHAIEELETLPGIGRSTAGAIASFAFGISAPIMDANVKRVFARYFGIQESLKEKKIIALLWNHAEKAIPQDRPGDYNQALMDLGSSICNAKNPQCLICPLNKNCVACCTQMQMRIPFQAKERKKEKPSKLSRLLLIQHNDRILLEKRPNFGIWGGLWSLPECSMADDPTIYCRSTFGIAAPSRKNHPEFKHVFTHYTAIFHPVRLPIKNVPMQLMEDGTRVWYKMGDALPGGLPTPIQKLLKNL